MVGVLGEVGQLCGVGRGRGFHSDDVAALSAPRVVGETLMQAIEACPALPNGVVWEVVCGNVDHRTRRSASRAAAGVCKAVVRSRVGGAVRTASVNGSSVVLAIAARVRSPLGSAPTVNGRLAW